MDDVQNQTIHLMLALVRDVLCHRWPFSFSNGFHRHAVRGCALNLRIQHNKRCHVPATSEAHVVHIGLLAQVGSLCRVVVDASNFFCIDCQFGHASVQPIVFEDSGDAIHGRAVVTKATSVREFVRVRLRPILHGELQPRAGQIPHIDLKDLEIFPDKHGVELVAQARPQCHPRQHFRSDLFEAGEFPGLHSHQVPPPFFPNGRDLSLHGLHWILPKQSTNVRLCFASPVVPDKASLLLERCVRAPCRRRRL